MNPIENPMTQMMQAFGATSPQSVAAMFGVQGASADIQENYASLFSGFVDASESTAATQAAFSSALQNRVQSIHAAPADSAFAIDPTSAATATPVLLRSEALDTDALSQLLTGRSADGDPISTEFMSAFALALDYRAATPLELSPASLQALQSALPTDFAKLGTAGDTAGLSLVQGTHGQSGGSSLPETTGHLLPASELRFLLGETTQMPASLAGQAAGVLLGAPHSAAGTVVAENAAVSPATLTTAPAQTVQTDQTAQAVQAGEQSALNQTASLAAMENRTDVASNQLHVGENGSDVGRAALAGKMPQMPAETDPDVDGQVLAVAQKNQTATKSNAAIAQAGTNTNPSGMGPAQANLAAAQSAIHSATSPATSGSPQRDLSQSHTEKNPNGWATGANGIEKSAEIAFSAPTRGAINWASPWTTPERAAGWPDSFATGLISSGLTGMSGQASGPAGMGLMGGQANPALGGQIAKQLNVQITRAVNAGDNSFSMRMDPPELGRVSVKLQFGPGGLVKSHVMAERPETLELLQREVRGLERAIEAGGNKSEPGGISFSLDSGSQESAGRAFAEAMQEDRLKDEIENGANGSSLEADGEMVEQEIDLEEILAHVTPETGLDVRV